MSDLSISNQRKNLLRDQQQELEELKQEHEAKVSRIRTDNAKREDEIREAGDAVVSHIRKSTSDRVDGIRNEAQTRLENEETALQKNYASLKKRSQLQNDSLNREIVTRRTQAQETMANVRENESQQLRRSQERLREFIDDQTTFRENARKKSVAEVEQVQRSMTEKETKLTAKHREEIREMEQRQAIEISDLKSESKNLYDKTRYEANRRLQELRHDSSNKLDNERRQSQLTIDDLRRRTRDATTSEQREGERRLDFQTKENQRLLEENRAKALVTNEKMQSVYSKEAQRIETTGEQDIQYRQRKFEDRKKEQVVVNKQTLAEQEAEQFKQEAKIREEHESRVQHVVGKMDETLQQKRTDFKEKYERDHDTFKSSLSNQRETYLKELYKQKRKIDERMGQEEARKDDPFYRLKTFNATIQENAGNYVIHAKVEPHEKDSVEIRVQDDKVTLSARRAHEDKFEDNGAKISTNTYQTYRQEFPLGAPGDAKRILKTVKDDGTISVMIPKKGWKPPVPTSKA